LFYKHTKIGNQARFCLAIYDFETHITLSLYLTFLGAGMAKFNFNVTAKCYFVFRG